MIYYSWRDTVYLKLTVVYEGILYYPGIYSRTRPLPEVFLNSNYVLLIALDDGYIAPNPYPPTDSNSTGSSTASVSAFVKTLTGTWQAYYNPDPGITISALPWIDLGGSSFFVTVPSCVQNERVLIFPPEVCFTQHWNFSLWRRTTGGSTWTQCLVGDSDDAWRTANSVDISRISRVTYGLNFGSPQGDVTNSTALLATKIDTVPSAGSYDYKICARATYFGETVFLGRNKNGLDTLGTRFQSHFIAIKLGV